jgi:hypothetical protein
MAGVTLIAEAAFQDQLWRPVLAPLVPRVPIRVLRCHVSPATARARTTGRPAAGRAAHQGTPMAADVWLPITLDVPTLTVDTTDGYVPAESEVIAFAAAT